MTRTHVKICGITNLEDARLALELGADYLGFIFHPPSPRSVRPETAAEIIGALSDFETRAIGVFVNEPLGTVNAIVRRAGLWGVQLHGEESPDFCARVQVPHVIKAFRVRENRLPDGVEDYDGAFAWLFDTFQRGRYGGTGKSFDHGILSDLFTGRRIFIAGGITPENVADAVALRPFCVDISSGVETEPGRKDPEKLRALFESIRKVKNR